MTWDERQHPREPAGLPVGGRFTFASGPASGLASSRGGQGGASAPPPSWDQPSRNPFARGMTEREETLDWLQRHGVERDGARFVFYRGEPLLHRDGSPNQPTTFGPRTLLEQDPAAARFFAGRDRGLSAGEVAVYVVRLLPWEIETGQWASTRVPVTGRRMR